MWADCGRGRAVGLAARLAFGVYCRILLSATCHLGREAFSCENFRHRGCGDPGTRPGRLFSGGACAAGVGGRAPEAWIACHDHHWHVVLAARRCGRPGGAGAERGQRVRSTIRRGDRRRTAGGAECCCCGTRDCRLVGVGDPCDAIRLCRSLSRRVRLTRPTALPVLRESDRRRAGRRAACRIDI
jgi:hypothetical protein